LKKLNSWYFLQKNPNNIQLSLGGVDIEKVSEIRFLGVVIDEPLTRKSQLAHKN